MSRCQVSRYEHTAPLRLPPLWTRALVVMYDSSPSTYEVDDEWGRRHRFDMANAAEYPVLHDEPVVLGQGFAAQSRGQFGDGGNTNVAGLDDALETHLGSVVAGAFVILAAFPVLAGGGHS